MNQSKTLSKNDDKGEDFLNEIIPNRTDIQIDQLTLDRKNNTYYVFNFQENLKGRQSEINWETEIFLSKLQKNKNVIYIQSLYNPKNKEVEVNTYSRGMKELPDMNSVLLKTSTYSYQDFSKLYRSFGIRFLNELNSFQEAQELFDKQYKSFNEKFPYIKSKKSSFAFSNFMLQGDKTTFFNVDDIYINEKGEVKLIEMLNCSGNQTIGPHKSHPNRYIGKNVHKFKSIYQLAEDSNASVFFINYAESDSKYNGEVKLMVHENKQAISNSLAIINDTRYNMKNTSKTVCVFDKEYLTNRKGIKRELNYYLNRSVNKRQNRQKLK